MSMTREQARAMSARKFLHEATGVDPATWPLVTLSFTSARKVFLSAHARFDGCNLAEYVRAGGSVIAGNWLVYVEGDYDVTLGLGCKAPPLPDGT
jgi:hypothetical protein